MTIIRNTAHFLTTFQYTFGELDSGRGARHAPFFAEARHRYEVPIKDSAAASRQLPEREYSFHKIQYVEVPQAESGHPSMFSSKCLRIWLKTACTKQHCNQPKVSKNLFRFEGTALEGAHFNLPWVPLN